MKYSEQIRNNILHIAASQRITDKEFIERTKMNRGSFYKFKKGELNISLEKIISISETFNISLDKLVFTDITKKIDEEILNMKEMKEMIIHLSKRIEDIETELKHIDKKTSPVH